MIMRCISRARSEKITLLYIILLCRFCTSSKYEQEALYSYMMDDGGDDAGKI